MAADVKLDTPTARRKLAPRDAPYYATVAKGISIGYRRGITQGTWSVRRFDGRRYHRRELGRADDIGTDAAGTLAYADALAAALAEPVRAETHRTRYTVEQAVTDYFASRAARSASAESLAVDRYKTKAFLEKFGAVQVAALTMSELQRWRDGLVGTPDPDATDVERRAQQRAGQATANRVWATCRAALNDAFRTGRVPSDLEWRRIRPFRGADQPRKRFLALAECNKLLGVAPPAFRDLAQAALLTGLRPGELVRLDVSAFEGTRLAVAAGKTGSGRHVPLTSAGQAFFRKLVKGRAPSDIMLPNVEGERWTRMQIARAMRDAVAQAKLGSPAVFYDLRRTYGSLLANAGARDTTIAASLGHSDTRMTRRHYAHILESTVAAELEAKLPTFKPARSRKTVNAGT